MTMKMPFIIIISILLIYLFFIFYFYFLFIYLFFFLFLFYFIFFFECNNYAHQRMILLHQTRNFHPLRLNAVLFGKISLSDEDNFVLFEAIKQYIKDSRRFE